MLASQTSGQFRGVDFNERTVTIRGLKFGHYMSSCLFSFSFIGLNKKDLL